MPLRLYNTRTRRVEPFATLDPGRVRIYVCGLTPSAEAHLGHARSFLFFDVLRRYLEHPRNGFAVTYVQNVTDVDDRSIATAAREGTTYDAVVRRYYGAFKAAMTVLGVREPDREPYATHYVPQIVTMIGELIERGHAYATDDGVYYRVASFPRYGALSGKNVDELLVGARIAENEHKDDPLDFALWKFARPDEPRWDAPWGAGRPGWHIECSAMSRALLGVPFDVHGGGYDLIFPHHENEIAQSEPLMDAPPMATTWVHGGLLNFEGRKMSKSLGNFEPLTALLERHDPFAIRLLFLQTGYRKPMNFTEESIAAATAALEKLVAAFKRAESGERDAAAAPASREPGAHREIIFAHLDDDMNTAGALGAVFDLAADLGRYELDARDAAIALMREVFGVFGIEGALDRERPVAFDAAFVERLRARLAEPSVGAAIALNGESPEAAIEAVIARRAEARRDRDFGLGDRLRDALAAEGVALKDSKDGTTWTAGGT
ncbi:MAG TPA: cysteine--tRNA ligase [Candidatus Elarobacter sp.]|nr:cysteine--tRNA ligase [Candidatus Elarobacter sp.]